LSPVEKGENVSEKEYKIIVSGQEMVLESDHVTYEQLIAFVMGSNVPGDGNIPATITYSHGPKDNRSGSLNPGQSIEIKNEMIFVVTPTSVS
jgi:hypothetical protein